MKRFFKMLMLLSFFSLAIVGCRDNNDRTDGADMEVKDNGDKVKIKTDDKTVKIKKDEDGNVTKKVKTND